MFRKEYRAINVNNRSTKDIVAKLTAGGIKADTYRINHFSTNKEIVAEVSVAKKIKSIIG